MVCWSKEIKDTCRSRGHGILDLREYERRHSLYTVVCKLCLCLFCFLAADVRKDYTNENPHDERDDFEKRHLRRCTIAGMLHAAEHITVVPRHGDAHEMGQNEREDGENAGEFFHHFLLYIIKISVIRTVLRSESSVTSIKNGILGYDFSSLGSMGRL